jgi:RNA polymerase sigma-70 factor (ECF subfamily)
VATVPWQAAAAVDDFDTFYAANFNRLVVGLFAYTGDMALAQDLAQEAFCRALQRWNSVARYDDPLAWIRRVAWNLTRSRWRRHRTAQAHLRTQRETHVAPPSPDRVALEGALAKLPGNQRRAIVLYYLADMSVADIAAQEGASEGTVRSLLHRGRAALAVHLSDIDA